MAAKKYKKLTKKELNEYKNQIVEYCADAICDDIGLDYTMFYSKLMKSLGNAVSISEFFYHKPWLYKVDDDA